MRGVKEKQACQPLSVEKVSFPKLQSAGIGPGAWRVRHLAMLHPEHPEHPEHIDKADKTRRTQCACLPVPPLGALLGLERANKDPRYEKVTHFALEFFFGRALEMK